MYTVFEFCVLLCLSFTGAQLNRQDFLKDLLPKIIESKIYVNVFLIFFSKVAIDVDTEI